MEYEVIREFICNGVNMVIIRDGRGACTLTKAEWNRIERRNKREHTVYLIA